MASKTDLSIRRNGHRVVYFRYDDEVWVDADLGIWRWGWEDKLIEVGA